MKLKTPTPESASAPAASAPAASAPPPRPVPRATPPPPPPAAPVKPSILVRIVKVAGFGAAIAVGGVAASLALNQWHSGDSKSEAQKIRETEEAVNKLLRESKAQAEADTAKVIGAKDRVVAQAEAALAPPATSGGSDKGGSWFPWKR